MVIGVEKHVWGKRKKPLWQMIILLMVIGLLAALQTHQVNRGIHHQLSRQTQEKHLRRIMAQLVKSERSFCKGRVWGSHHPCSSLTGHGRQLGRLLNCTRCNTCNAVVSSKLGKQDYLGLNVPNYDITGSLEVLLDANPDLIIVDGVVDAAKYGSTPK